MYDDQDRPPWLRDLRTVRREPEAETADLSAPTFTEPGITEATADSLTEPRRAMTRRQMLVLALLLWGNVSILGCLCLLATQRVIP